MQLDKFQEMKNFILLLALLIFTNCTNKQYNEIEDSAIKDIANHYLTLKHLSNRRIKPPPLPSEDNNEKYVAIEEEKQGVYKVFISDALLPISQIKEDNHWMFDELYNTPSLDSLFESLENSKVFNQLDYREFDKTQIKFIEPYQQFTDRKNEIGKDEEYLIFSFSRICFSSDYKFGLVVIDYSFGWPNGTGGGFNRPYLIEKINNEWKVIDEE